MIEVEQDQRGAGEEMAWAKPPSAAFTTIRLERKFKKTPWQMLAIHRHLSPS